MFLVDKLFRKIEIYFANIILIKKKDSEEVMLFRIYTDVNRQTETFDLF